MKNKNTKEMFDFVLDNILWGLIVFSYVRIVTFEPIGTLSAAVSKVIFWAINIVLITIGILITKDKRRNILSEIVNVISPVSLYILLSYWSKLSWRVYVVLAIAAVLSVVYCALVFSQKVENTQRKKLIMKRRAEKVFLGVRTIASLCVGVLALVVCLSSLGVVSITSSDVKAVSGDEASEWTIENKIDTVSNFTEDKWYDLSEREKLSSMQTIANIEREYLGIPYKLKVKTGVLDGDTLAHYSSTSNHIVVDIEYLKTSEPDKALNTICHEVYHAYQYCLCRVYDKAPSDLKSLKIFNNVAEYEEEFKNYEDGKEDYEGYYYQAAEASAREYAQDACLNYKLKIYKFTGIYNFGKSEEATNKKSK